MFTEPNQENVYNVYIKMISVTIFLFACNAKSFETDCFASFLFFVPSGAFGRAEKRFLHVSYFVIQDACVENRVYFIGDTGKCFVSILLV